MTNLSLYLAFSAGLLSFFSPCVLPLIPTYLIYITGISLKELDKNRFSILANSLLFILGFSLVFICLGASASLLGQFLSRYRELMRIIGGLMIIFFGFYLLGVFKLKLLDMEKRLSLPGKPSSFIVGIIFAAAWTPCVGPILGSILILSSTAQTTRSGILLLVAYSLGLALPFLVASSAINFSLRIFKNIQKYFGMIEILSGIFLILVGVALLTNYFQTVINLLI